MDACGVCDSNLNNDNTTCILGDSPTEDPLGDGSVEDEGDSPTEDPLGDGSVEDEGDVPSEDPLGDGSVEDEGDVPSEDPLGDGSVEDEGDVPSEDPLGDGSVEDEGVDPLQDIDENIFGDTIDEDHYVAGETSYPTVPGALYLDIDNPLVAEEFADIIQEFGIDDIYQPFDNLDISTYRIEFDPSLSHEDLITALQERFGDSIQFVEPIPLVQLNVAW